RRVLFRSKDRGRSAVLPNQAFSGGLETSVVNRHRSDHERPRGGITGLYEAADQVRYSRQRWSERGDCVVVATVCNALVLRRHVFDLDHVNLLALHHLPRSNGWGEDAGSLQFSTGSIEL